MKNEKIIEVEANEVEEVNEEVTETTEESKGGLLNKIKEKAKSIDKKKVAKTAAVIGIGVIGAFLIGRSSKKDDRIEELPSGDRDDELEDNDVIDVEYEIETEENVEE